MTYQYGAELAGPDCAITHTQKSFHFDRESIWVESASAKSILTCGLEFRCHTRYGQLREEGQGGMYTFKQSLQFGRCRHSSQYNGFQTLAFFGMATRWCSNSGSGMRVHNS